MPNKKTINNEKSIDFTGCCIGGTSRGGTAFGIGIRHNRYYLASPLRDKDGVIFDYTPVGGDWHTDNLYTDAGWRLGISAGIWHRCIGLTAGWNYRSVLPGHKNVIHAGLSIRY